VSHCRHGLGVPYRRAGTPQAAREQLATAATMFVEMDMRYERGCAETEREQVA
jgi:hypothetical protein